MKSKTKVRTISPYNDHSDNYFLVIFYEISLVILSEEQITSIDISEEQKRSDDEVKKYFCRFYNWTEQKNLPDFNLKPVRRLQWRTRANILVYLFFWVRFSDECEIGFFPLFCGLLSKHNPTVAELRVLMRFNERIILFALVGYETG